MLHPCCSAAPTPTCADGRRIGDRRPGRGTELPTPCVAPTIAGPEPALTPHTPARLPRGNGMCGYLWGREKAIEATDPAGLPQDKHLCAPEIRPKVPPPLEVISEVGSQQGSLHEAVDPGSELSTPLMPPLKHSMALTSSCHPILVSLLPTSPLHLAPPDPKLFCLWF